MTTGNQATFPGFQFPNTTQIPNEVFDTLMSRLTGGELKVLLYICRRTFGFRKDSDRISLTQIAHGITTKTGRVLDYGTGLSKRQVQRALRALEAYRVIHVERKVDETGLHEINTYRLNVRCGETMSPLVETPVSGGIETSVSLGVETPVPTTKHSNQKKEEQKQDNDVDAVASDLKKFGMTQSAATVLLKRYPAPYIREKLGMVKGLVAAKSALVSQNPAGWLRRAIEDNYHLPRPSQNHRQYSISSKKSTIVQTKPKNEPQPTHNASTEQMNPEKPSREHVMTWNKTLENLLADLPGEEAAARLTGTTLIDVTDTAARILVPSTSALLWLERRLYGQIANTMKGVLGKDLDLQFIAAF